MVAGAASIVRQLPMLIYPVQDNKRIHHEVWGNLVDCGDQSQALRWLRPGAELGHLFSGSRDLCRICRAGSSKYTHIIRFPVPHSRIHDPSPALL